MNTWYKRLRLLVRQVWRRTPAQQAWFRWQDLRFFLRYLRGSRRYAVIGLFLALMMTFFSTLFPLSGKILIDYVILGQEPTTLIAWLHRLHLPALVPGVLAGLQSLPTVLLIMTVLGVVTGFMSVVRTIAVFQVQQHLTRKLRTALFEHVLRLPMSRFHQYSSGYLVSRINNDTQSLQYLLTQAVPQVVCQMFRFGLALMLLCALSWKLTLAVLAAVPVYLVLNLFIPSRMRRISNREMEQQARVSERMQDVIGGVALVKAMTTEDRETQRLSTRLSDLVHTRQQSLMLQLLSQLSVQAVQYLTGLVILVLGVWEIRQGTMTIGDYVAFTAYITTLSRPVQDLSLLHVSLQPAFSAMDRLVQLFRHAGEESPPRFDSSASTPDIQPLAIRFDSVSFGYTKTRTVLERFSFRANRGAITVLVGPSGSGKTTVFNLILRLYEGDAGAIFIDQTPLSAIHLSNLRRMIAWSGQDSIVFNDTIEANLRYGNPDISRALLEQVTRDVGLYGDITRLPSGFSTTLSEGGSNLSGGQRQRLTLARALLHPGPILLLDEPTSSLDEEMEQEVFQNIRRHFADRIVLLISHRPSIAQFADQLIRMGV